MAAPLFGNVGEFLEGKEEWTQYEERLTHFFDANGIDEEAKKRSILLSMIGPAAYKLLRDLITPKKPAELSYKELVEAMSKHHNPAPSEIVQRYKFNSRVRRSGESIAAFTAELRSLAKFCNFGDCLDDMLRDRLVCGVADVQIQKRLLAETKLSLQKATEIALGMEAAAKNVQTLQPTTPKGNAQDESLLKVQTGFRKNFKKQIPKSTQACYRCGAAGHTAQACKHKSTKCHACGKLGHLQKVCRSKPKKDNSQHQGVHTVETEALEYQLYRIYSSQDSNSPPNPYVLEVELDEEPVQMEIDTGASVSILSSVTYEEKFTAKPLQASPVKLRTYADKPLQNLGSISVQVKHNSQEMQLPVLVVAGNGPNLLGRDWLEKLQINWKAINHLGGAREEVGQLCSEFPGVFQSGLGTLKGFKASIKVDREATPVFCKARPVPYAMKPLVEKELERLEEEGVIEPISFADWAAPIVPVLKSNKTVRICGDFKLTVNKVSKLDRYPIPRIDDLFSKLAGGKLFSKLDLSQAYLQVCLEEEAKKFVVVNTHKGLYRYNRLPYGISSAPGIFQRTMESLLQGIPQVVVYLDDILVTGGTPEEHMCHLREVLQRLSTAGLRLQKNKCTFMATSVQYLGHVIDEKGLHPIGDKVEAVQKAPSPKNLASKLAPLYALLRSAVPWKWTSVEEEVFKNSKALLLTSQVLVHFDPAKPLLLSCDASPYGIGAVLSHREEDGTDRPIGFASRTLSTAEAKYSQLEKEGLACVFGVKRFHSYLYGHTFTLMTDHKPLLGLLGERRAIPPQASARIQRWALTLAMYEYTLVYRSSGAHGNADAMSRLPLKQQPASVPVPEEVVLLMEQLQDSPTDVTAIRKATAHHPLLSRVLQFVQQGWLDQCEEEELKPFWSRRTELSVQEGCLLWGNRVVIPPSLQSGLLLDLHAGHPGVSRMKSLCRMYVWWPGIDKDVETMVQGCEECQHSRPAPPSAPLHPWKWPGTPWSRLHLDFAGPFMGSQFLVVVDAHSKWIEVYQMASTASSTLIEKLRVLFAQFGIPQVIVTDNGSPFVSRDFELFLKVNGIKHITSAPYHPASNGLAERAVQTFKAGIKKMKEGQLVDKLSRFLFTYRNTPQTTTGVCPAEMLIGRRLRSQLDLIKPDLQARVHQKQLEQKQSHDRHAKDRTFGPKDQVFAKNFRQGQPWVPAEIVKNTGPLSYLVRVLDSGVLWRRHQDHIRVRYFEAPTADVTEDSFIPVWTDVGGSESVVGPECSVPDTPSAVTPRSERRYPERDRRPPERFTF